MKVRDLIENNDWNNDPVGNDQYILYIQRKINDLYDEREMWNQRLSAWQSGKIQSKNPGPMINRIHDKIKQIDNEKERLNKLRIAASLNMKHIIHDAGLAFRHAQGVRNGAFPEGEKAIAKDGYWAIKYAIEVTHRRFPQGEDAMREYLRRSEDSGSGSSDYDRAKRERYQYETSFKVTL